ncbi:MAG: phage tail protein [Phycisphaeraceae bacterium]|nr:phage tail protein [Phycisphaeraceae bacterium]
MALNPYLGTMVPFAGLFAPKGWSFCNGQLLPINQNQALFSLLGTNYGGNGTTNFALPDMRGRIAIGDGSGPGLSARSIGNQPGFESIALNSTQLPIHTHQVRVIPSEGTSSLLTGKCLAKASDGRDRWSSTGAGAGVMGASSVNSAGTGAPHDNMQPGLVINWIIAIQGLFPPRN